MKTSKPIQIFKSGKHTAMSGAALSFSETDLAATAAAYDPAKHEAPIVVGHPTHDAPAYGWVGKLSVEGGLSAYPQQVDPAFAEMVARGAFKKISASFYSPDSPSNPVPGVYYLRHVGFLGAQPPAVKGLRSPEFADAEQGVVEFADYDDVVNAGLWRRLRDWMIGEKGLDVADSIIPDYQVSTLETMAQQDDDQSSTGNTPFPNFADPTKPQGDEMSAEQIAELAALKAENEKLKQAATSFAEAEKTRVAAARHAENVAFAEGLIKEGKLLPANKDVTVATLDNLAGQEQAVNFGEGDTKKPLVDAYKASLSAAPKIVNFSELSGDKGAVTDPAEKDASQLAAEAVQFQEAELQAGRVITTAQAVQHVMKKP